MFAELTLCQILILKIYYSEIIFKFELIFLVFTIPSSMPDVLARKTAIPGSGDLFGIYQFAIDTWDKGFFLMGSCVTICWICALVYREYESL